MDEITIDQYAERWVQALARTLTHPRAGECLVCYVLRMLNEFGCDESLRFACTFRDRCAPRATALERRLGETGAFCDCEIFLNGVRRAPHLRVHDPYGQEVVSGEPPTCARVRRGSTQGCASWVRRRRGGYDDC